MRVRDGVLCLLEIYDQCSTFIQACCYCAVCHIISWLARHHNIQLEIHECILSTVATDALVLKRQAISIHSAD